jgi:phosphoglycerate-specific signal transduction histidine kinase
LTGTSNTDDAARPSNEESWDKLRETVTKLSHELAEALTAIGSYLTASGHLEDAGDSADRARLREAISKAIEQTNRAGRIVTQLRDIGKGQGN